MVGIKKGKKGKSVKLLVRLQLAYGKLQKTLLNLENEGFDTDTWSDRMEILKEVSCFQIYVVSNEVKVYEKDKKILFITDIAKKLNETVNVNQVDLKIPEKDVKTKFINLLNERIEEYSELEYTDEPSYKARIILGNHLMKIWVN